MKQDTKKPKKIRAYEKLELGRVYRASNKPTYRLAVDEHKLVSAYGNVVVVHKQSVLTLMADLTAEDLCTEWGIGLGDLDALSVAYLYPDLKPKPRHLERGERGRSRSPAVGMIPHRFLTQ